jgi:hypothetical protein
MSLSGLELQYDQTSTMLLIIQKYSSTAVSYFKSHYTYHHSLPAGLRCEILRIVSAMSTIWPYKVCAHWLSILTPFQNSASLGQRHNLYKFIISLIKKSEKKTLKMYYALHTGKLKSSETRVI